MKLLCQLSLLIDIITFLRMNCIPNGKNIGKGWLNDLIEAFRDPNESLKHPESTLQLKKRAL